MHLDKDALARIEAAFDAAQQRTGAPFEGVLASASGRYETPGLILTLALALFAPWPLIVFTRWQPQGIFLAQLALALLLALLNLWPRLGVRLTPVAARRANVHRAALAQYSARGLDRAAKGNGVLIYVSLAERSARVEAGAAALAAAPLTQWQKLIDAVSAKIGADDLEGAMILAASGAGDLLAPAFPADPDAPARPHQRFHAR